MADRLSIDCSTGQAETVPLSAEEQADADARAAEHEAEQGRVAQREQRRTDAITQLRQIAQADTLTAAQVQAAVKFQAKVLAKVLPFLDLDPE